MRGHGYHVEHRELRASDFGAPTIRKRFFLVARRDGIPIVWPAPTHGAPDKNGVQSGKLQPWRTAAECIDWSAPCPSIFERSRPLADATLRRIAKGIMRYVVNSASPFIVPLTHQGGDRIEGIGEPFRTITGANRGERAFISPTIVPIAHYNGRDTVHDVAAPLSTVTAHPRGGSHALMAATLVQTGYGERAGQAPRALDIEKPLGTVVGGASKHAVVPALLVDAAHGEVSPSGVKRGGQGCKDVEQPFGTITASGGNQALVSAFLAKHYTGVVGSDLDEPIGTVTSTDRHSLVSACLVGVGARAGQSRPRGIEEPIATVTAKYDTALVTSNLIKLRGTSSTASTDEPLHTISAGGQHHVEVRAFLLSYYGTDQAPQLDGPLATVTSRDRFGLVTIHGQDYQIVDIDLRMLMPRELFRAQGFPERYIIGDDAAQGLQLTKSAQMRMCGNSVCPPMAKALIVANFAHEKQLS